MLGVRPGAVTPFGLLNDRDHRVDVVLDSGLAAYGQVNAHPLHNEATTTILWSDLLRFLDLTGHAPRMVDFDRLEELERARAATG